jgi:hypothetical protein
MEGLSCARVFVALLWVSCPPSRSRAPRCRLDGGWGCGCGGPAYYVVPQYAAPAFVEPVPAFIYPQVQVVVGPPVVYAPGYAYGPRPWGHHYYGRRYY